MPGRYEHQRFCDLAEAEIATLAEAVRGADPDTLVPTCGAWRLGTLIQHIGQIHRWAGGMVAVLSPERHPRRAEDYPPPADPAGYADWIREGGSALLAALRQADPDAPMWAWGADQHARFWSRRMAHETAVHRVDAQLALGVEPELDAAVAVDGVDESLENLPLGLRRSPSRLEALRGNGERLRLLATDQPQAWTITLLPDRFDWQPHPPGGAPPDGTRPGVAVRASAADLYLLLWRRRHPTDPRYTVDGDAALLRRWYDNSAF